MRTYQVNQVGELHLNLMRYGSSFIKVIKKIQNLNVLARFLIVSECFNLKTLNLVLCKYNLL
jgi:hypothetical protein